VRPDQNPYQAYTDGSIFSDSPLNLVVALYEGAVDATRQAESALRTRDIPGRTKAINKAISILTELIVSLDLKRGGEIAQNLKRLYSYMQTQLLNAHIRQVPEPLEEVSKLLTTLLEGWRAAGRAERSASDAACSVSESATAKHSPPPAANASAPVYGGYLDDSLAAFGSTAYSF
jgi:flagellar protein FliS